MTTVLERYYGQNYVVVVGSVNIDVAGYSSLALSYADSNPGKVTWTPGGVGRNIAHNLALLGKNPQLISVVGDDFYGRALLEQTRLSGVNIDNCVYCSGEQTSTYLSLLDNTGEMLVAINDMDIVSNMTPAFLANYLHIIQHAAAIVADCNISEASLLWLTDNAGSIPLFVDPVSAWKCVKIKNCLSRIHTLKPNRLEAETLSGIPVLTHADVIKVAHWFHEQNLPRLVLSMGAEGVYYSELNGKSGWSPSVTRQITNVTGAGDAMLAGLVVSWLDDCSMTDAVRFAQGCAAMALTSEYTNNPNLSVSQVIKLLEKNNV